MISGTLSFVSAGTHVVTVRATDDDIRKVDRSWRYGDGFTIAYTDLMDARSATYLGNYQVNNGLRILSATLNLTRKVVSFRTSPQAPNTTCCTPGCVAATAAANASSLANSSPTFIIRTNSPRARAMSPPSC